MPIERPQHLPDYSDPPLNEVVLGIQYVPVPAYSSINAQEIWNLFCRDFPIVQEQPLIPPVFETFGGTNLRPSFQFEIGGAPVGSRLWFIAPNRDHLIQFQSDRFLANWRKQSETHDYPHFEPIAAAFEKNLSSLEKYFLERFSYTISINQAEVSYINLIPVEDFSDVGLWFSFWQGKNLNMETMNLNFKEIMRGSNGQPIARLHHELQSVFTMDGRHKAFQLSLTFRGKPPDGNINSALDFIKLGREVIVNRFTLMTTTQAHEHWGRVS